MTLARRHAIFGMFSAAVILFAFEPIRRLIILSLDRDNSHLSYIVMIPLITVALVYWKRKDIFRDLRSSVLPATAAMAVGGGLYYAGRKYGLHLAENDYLALIAAAVITLLLGGFLLAYGSSAFRAGLFPLMFAGMAIPLPNRILDGFVGFLQRGSAEVVSILFALTGTPVYRSNEFIFALPSLTIEVAEACSGIRSTLGMLIVTLLAAHLFLRTNWRRTALLIAVIPISLFKNAVRIVTLTLLAIHYDMGFLTGSLHRDGGIFFMLGGLSMMYPVLLILMRSDAKGLYSGVRS